jgi:hypothetical protein
MQCSGWNRRQKGSQPKQRIQWRAAREFHLVISMLRAAPTDAKS